MADDEFTVDGLRAAAERGDLARWVEAFLASDGSDNAPLAAGLVRANAAWEGPVRLPLDSLNRLAGPEGAPVLVEVDDDEWDARVDDMADKVRSGWDPPPLVVTYRDGQLVLEDGNHRVEALRRAGASAGWAVVGFEDDAARAEFRSATPP